MIALLCFFFLFQAENDKFDLGKQLIERGRTETALRVWLNEMVNKPEDGDPRIGSAFIETVTEERMLRYYPVASTMFIWGLRSSDPQKFEKQIKLEGKRIAPLLNEYDSKLLDKIDKDEARLQNFLRQYWLASDPTPATDLNERLIEHWIRISEARALFGTGRSDPYQTDERGIYYVKYGEPDDRVPGILVLNQLLRASDFSLVQGEQSVNAVIEYEHWVYNRPDVTNGDILLIFSNYTDGTGGAFRFVPSPERLLERSVIRNVGLPVIESIYEEFKKLHPLYTERYNAVFNIVNNQLPGGFRLNQNAQRTFVNRFMSESVAYSRFALTRIEQEDSEVEKRARNINVQYNACRMLNENNEPIIFTIIESEPTEVVQANAFIKINNLGFSPARYNLINSISLNPLNDDFVITAADTTEVVVTDILSEPRARLLSFFEVPHREKAEAKLIVSSKVSDPDEEETVNPRTLMPRNLVGLGTVEANLSAPLDPSKFEVSDLIIGYLDSNSVEVDLSRRFPFIISLDETFGLGNKVFVWFGVYNLAVEGSSYHFTANYTMKPVPSLGQQDLQSVNINYYPNQNRAENFFEIETSDLSAGLYELGITFTDEKTGESIQRKKYIRFY